MATVDILLPAFGIKWAQDGTVEAIDEAQWRAGWSFIGATPPSVEQFNKVHQIQDEKSNYLYAQMAAIYTAAGVTPAAGTLTSLRDAIRLLTGVYGTLIATRVFSTPGAVTYTPTAGTRLIDVEMVGGGGAGGGNVAVPGGSDLSIAGGGGAGAYARGIFTTGFSGVSLTTGAAGVGSSGSGGTSGTASSLGALITAPGGQGGGVGGVTTPGASGYRLGGTGQSSLPTGANVVGSPGAGGSYAFYLSAGSFQSGGGGASVFGTGAPPLIASAAGANADTPGAGGGGSMSTGGGPARAGGSGGNGRVIIREYA